MLYLSCDYYFEKIDTLIAADMGLRIVKDLFTHKNITIHFMINRYSWNFYNGMIFNPVIPLARINVSCETIVEA